MAVLKVFSYEDLLTDQEMIDVEKRKLKETWEFSGIKILLLKINQRIHIPRSSVELRFQEKVPEVLGRLFAQGHQTRLSPWDSAPWF